jgi:hypothetical protein
MDDYEIELLENKKELGNIHSLLSSRQFSEDFLIKIAGYYDSWKCLKTQDNLSPYFCFRYLYDVDTDSADNWTDYNDVMRYLKKLNKYTEEFIEGEFQRAMKDRK